MSLSRSEGLEAALEEFERLVFDRFPHVFAVLRPPVSEAALDNFADEFGQPLPDEFRCLYRWHDGMDLLQAPHRTRDTLPGLGHWWPLVRLPSECLGWQDAWPNGFDSSWIPITWINEGALVIDASAEPSQPALVHKISVDGINGSAPSIHELFDQLNGVIRSSFWAAGATPNGADGWASEPDFEDFTIFDPHRSDFVLPSNEPKERFAITRRHPPADPETATIDEASTDGTLTDEAFTQSAHLMDSLIDLAIVAAGRDALLLRPIRLSLTRLRENTPVWAARTMRADLDLIGRILDQHLAPELWSEQFADVEAMLWPSNGLPA